MGFSVTILVVTASLHLIAFVLAIGAERRRSTGKVVSDEYDDRTFCVYDSDASTVYGMSAFAALLVSQVVMSYATNCLCFGSGLAGGRVWSRACTVASFVVSWRWRRTVAGILRRLLLYLPIKRKNTTFVVREGNYSTPPKILKVEGKGKGILVSSQQSSPQLKSNGFSPLKSSNWEASSSNMKIFVNNFGHSNAISDLWPEINANFLKNDNKNSHGTDEECPVRDYVELPGENFSFPSLPKASVSVQPNVCVIDSSGVNLKELNGT
ncbi:hypothetical protein IEQ34_021002 [Dendrobium chrysotoxum]|uniref:Uncharacterized protein n=1 Tax=Dendrobium chrysotoxum TaxID=161865 RepID=A0AAV7G2C8_DENCH|nr:hypothetical protein IEQ34_021002 [Dendrobium chrysotoxum]